VLRDSRNLDIGDRGDLDQAAVEVRPKRLQAREVELLDLALAAGSLLLRGEISAAELLLEGQELADRAAHEVDEE
jgi:hypothetical protein